MQEWIRQIIIYVILVTVLRGLIMKPQYEQYFRFFSGSQSGATRFTSRYGLA